MSVDAAVRNSIYRHFVDGGLPPTTGQVASALGLTPDEAAAAYERLADDHVIVLVPGSRYIWMANPFSGVPTNFTVHVGDKRWWGNCIWDALGILAGMHADGTVATWCPDCGDEIEVRVDGGDIASDASNVHFSVPAAQWWDDIGHT